jgi:hypothetical protein
MGHAYHLFGQLGHGMGKVVLCVSLIQGRSSFDIFAQVDKDAAKSKSPRLAALFPELSCCGTGKRTSGGYTAPARKAPHLDLTPTPLSSPITGSE